MKIFAGMQIADISNGFIVYVATKDPDRYPHGPAGPVQETTPIFVADAEAAGKLVTEQLLGAKFEVDAK